MTSVRLVRKGVAACLQLFVDDQRVPKHRHDQSGDGMGSKGFAVSIISAVIAGVILWLIIPTNDRIVVSPPADGSDNAAPTVHYQEATFRRFTTPLRESRPYTRVFGYLDFDSSSADRSDADLMITAHFFADPPKPNEMRSLHSTLRVGTAESVCRQVVENSEGSANVNIRSGQNYCMMSNQGRLVNFQIMDILGSWGANAEIEVRYSFKTFKRP